MATRKSLKDTLKDFELRIENLSSSITPFITNYETNLNELNKIADKIEESWSGSWIGSHANLYFRGFEKPKWNEKFDSEWGLIYGIPESWEEKNYDNILSFVNAHYKGKSVSEMEECLSSWIERVEELRTDISTELSLIENFENYDKEIKILGEIEDIKWGIPLHIIVEALKPTEVVTRDHRSIYEGIKAPPHIRYRARVLSLLITINSFRDFIKKSRRLIRQLEIKENIADEGTAILDSISSILRICERFHVVVEQLKNRHANRPTLRIDDEYDVQDLLHSLLRIFFDDVRPEEWTPSYAGGSSRIDFLLKKEKIIVEVKKTRKNLTDKEIGEQLLVDIAKYRQHPDCKNLICLVYDPENRIKNPVGLSNDLDQLSDKKIQIITVIEPSR